MRDYEDDYQNRFYQEGVLSQEQLDALDSVVNTDTMWDEVEPPDDDDFEFYDEDAF